MGVSMCGRFYIDDQMINEMEKIFTKMDQKKSDFNSTGKDCTPKKGEVFPSECSYMVRQEDNDRIGITTGFFGYQNPYKNGLLINAKSETVMEKPTYKYDFEKRRCVVPVAGYYEWLHKKDTASEPKNKSDKFFFYGQSSIIYLAGIYHEDRFVILTTAANEHVKKIHDRMPLILSKEEVEEYISSLETAKQYLMKRCVIQNIEKCVIE